MLVNTIRRRVHPFPELPRLAIDILHGLDLYCEDFMLERDGIGDDDEGITLMCAVIYGTQAPSSSEELGVVSFLLEHGATVRDIHIMLAFEFSTTEILELLVKCMLERRTEAEKTAGVSSKSAHRSFLRLFARFSAAELHRNWMS